MFELARAIANIGFYMLFISSYNYGSIFYV